MCIRNKAKVIVYVAVAEHDCSPLYKTPAEAKQWVITHNPEYGPRLYTIQRWELTEQEYAELIA